jgi:CcmD family protein
MGTVTYNQAFIFAAYTVTWAVILGYTFRLSRATARARAAYESAARAATGEAGR